MSDNETTAKDESTEMGVHEPLPVARQLLLLGSILFLLLGGSLLSYFDTPEKERLPAQVITEEIAPDEPTEVTSKELHIIEPITADITAQNAFVWDVVGKRALYQKDPDEQVPLASITKLMTALVAEELLTQKTAIPITISAIRQSGESGFYDGEQFAMQELLDLTLMTSSNDGAYALAAAAGSLLKDDGDANTFVQAMNIRAEELGLTQTYFRNPTGLDISSTESGGYGSARDASFLMEYILTAEPEILERTRESYVRIDNAVGNYHESENTNHIVNRLPGLIGSKTGYTDLAGGNLVVAVDIGLNRPVIITVLGSTRSERFNDVATLVNALQQ